MMLQSLEAGLKTQPTTNFIIYKLIMTRAKNVCEECESPYFADGSKMMGLCANCAHKLYSYPNCIHDFKNGVCLNCGWNGQEPSYIKTL